MTTETFPRFTAGILTMFCTSSLEISIRSVWQWAWPKLASCVRRAAESLSTAASGANPARTHPQVKPPAPQNRSMNVSSLFMLESDFIRNDNLLACYLTRPFGNSIRNLSSTRDLNVGTTIYLFRYRHRYVRFVLLDQVPISVYKQYFHVNYTSS